MFCSSSLQLVFLIILFTACTVLFANFQIFFVYADMGSRLVISMMIFVISACRGNVMCGLLFP